MLNKYRYHIVIALVILVIAVLWFRKYKKAAIQQDPALGGSSTTPASAGGSVTVTPPASVFPLQVGSRNDSVKRLQVALNRINPADKITEDGIFGTSTKTKLILSVATSMYGPNGTVTEDQLNKLIAMGNQA